MLNKEIIAYLLICCFSFPVLAKSALEVNPYGQFLSDQNGLVTMEVATVARKNKSGLNDLIIIMEGFAAYEEGIDGHAIKYRAVPSSRGFDLRVTKDGKDWTRLTSRKGWGDWTSLEVSLAGERYALVENSNRGKKVHPKHIVTALEREKTRKKAKVYDVNPYGISLSSSDGNVQAEVAVFRKKNKKNQKDVLLKITGKDAFTAGIDGKVMKYEAVPASKKGIRYQYVKDGKVKGRMMKRKIYGTYGWEIYLKGKTHKMFVDAAKSSSVKPLHLLTEYQKTRK